MLALLALFACTKDDVQDSEVEDTQVDDTAVVADADGDGFDSIAAGGEDCDDTDASVYPGAEEICDAVDQDCDGDLVEDFENVDGDAYADCDDPDPCVTPNTALVSWYPGSDTSDVVGGVALNGSISSSAGMVGEAWDMGTRSETFGSPNSEAWLTSDSWSAEFWLKTSETEAAYLVFHAACWGKCQGGTNQASVVGLELSSEGKAVLRARDGDSGFETPPELLTGTTSVNDGAWHHVAGVVDSTSGTLSVYVDGALDASMSAVNNQLDGFGNIPDSVEPFYIAMAFESDTIPGVMDELSIYTGALSAGDVTAIYEAGIAGKCAP